jgi:orotate phosphoribosyltransferase
MDDVATTGGSLVETIDCLESQGIKVDSVIVLVDRNEGAQKLLQKINCKLISLFKIEEFRSISR